MTRIGSVKICSYFPQVKTEEERTAVVPPLPRRIRVRRPRVTERDTVSCDTSLCSSVWSFITPTVVDRIYLDVFGHERKTTFVTNTRGVHHLSP